MDKRKILTIILSLATLVAGFFAWLSVEHATIVSGSSTWEVPIILFSVYILLICLDVILFQDILFLELILGVTLLPSLIFSPHLFQFGAVLVGAYFLFVSSRAIRRELELNIKINIWKTLQSGKSFLLMAVAVVISMQYFLLISQLGGQTSVPKFDLTPVVKKIALPFMALSNPALKNVDNEALTVDQFILLTQQENLKNSEQYLDEQTLDANLPQNISALEKEMLKKQIRDNFTKSQNDLSQKTNELMLQSFHDQLSDIAGYQIIGSEKISDVYSAMIAEKLNKFLSYPVNIGSEKTSAYPIVLTLILILTIYPLGSLLCILVFLVVKLMFSIFVRTGIVNVNKITVQKEVIE